MKKSAASDDRDEPADRRGELENREVHGVSGLDPVMEAKLWRNPCWFAFRFNYIALRYNVPLYGWIQRSYGLSRPEFVVLYTLGLHDGALARDIAVSYGFPKNTLSRAIHKLTKAELIRRDADPLDGRNQVLRLLPEGKRIFDETLPRFVELEERMLETLNRDERDTLSRLLAKIVLDSVNWPVEVGQDEHVQQVEQSQQEDVTRKVEER
jgi:DNA-binding MarR family transcriptional regulator